jgi:hypothetical protein
MMAAKKKSLTSQQRALRTQQIILSIIGILIILSMVISLVSR